MDDRDDSPLLVTPWPLSETGGVFILPRAVIPDAYVGMTVFLTDDRSCRAGMVIAATGEVIIQIAYPPKHPFGFWAQYAS